MQIIQKMTGYKVINMKNGKQCTIIFYSIPVDALYGKGWEGKTQVIYYALDNEYLDTLIDKNVLFTCHTYNNFTYVDNVVAVNLKYKD